MSASATAVIAAAGSGQRLGAGGPKAFVEVGGMPLLGHALRAAASSAVTSVVVAAPGSDIERTEELVTSLLLDLEVDVIAGGATRAESVLLATNKVRTELLLIHDAARPLAPPELFDRIVARLRAHPEVAGVIAAAPVTDTIKRGVGGTDQSEGAAVSTTLSREDLWVAQTPQGFRRDALNKAQQDALGTGTLDQATDEASLIEAAGGKVLLEPNRAPNLKITTSGDILIAEALLTRPSGV